MYYVLCTMTLRRILNPRWLLHLQLLMMRRGTIVVVVVAVAVEFEFELRLNGV